MYVPYLVVVRFECSGNGMDYTYDPINATFTAGSTTATIAVPITKGNIIEENENFNLEIMIPPSSFSGRLSLGDRATAIGRIVDRSSNSCLSSCLNVFNKSTKF